MITRAQRKLEKLEKLIFHHGLIKLIVLEQLKKEGKDWSTFLFISNYQVDLPFFPTKHKKSRKQSKGSSTAAVIENPLSTISPALEESLPIPTVVKDKDRFWCDDKD